MAPRSLTGEPSLTVGLMPPLAPDIHFPLINIEPLRLSSNGNENPSA
jgi:hypothetical protein